MAEGARLESVFRGNSNVGSNPTLSASVIWYLRVGDTYTDTRIREDRRRANREVNLTKRVQTPQGMRYCRVVLSANGRVKPDLIVINGKPETHKEGRLLS